MLHCAVFIFIGIFDVGYVRTCRFCVPTVDHRLRLLPTLFIHWWVLSIFKQSLSQTLKSGFAIQFEKAAWNVIGRVIKRHDPVDLLLGRKLVLIKFGMHLLK